MRENRLEDKVECLSGRIEDVELPEKVDIIVSVFTGNFLLTEDLLPSLFYARDKYLAPGGKLVPSAAVMEAAPASVPAVHSAYLGKWSESYFGVDFSAGRRFAANSLIYRRGILEGHECLSTSADLMSLDFYRCKASDTNCKAQTSFSITKDGVCHGVVGWFKMKLGTDWLSTSPHCPEVHWTPVVMPVDPVLKVAKGESMTFSLERPIQGDWTWKVEHGTRKQTASTFVSRVLSAKPPVPSNLRPRLSPRTMMMRAILERYDGRTQISEVVDAVMMAYPDQEYTRDQLLRMALNLSR